MRNDVPAALPLICFVAGLAAAPYLLRPMHAAAGLAVAALLGLTLGIARAGAAHVRIASALLFSALGILFAVRAGTSLANERMHFEAVDPERFVTVRAPIERDWAPRGESFVLRSSRFRADGLSFASPVAIYARFEPAEIEMEASVRAEGFLRRNEHGGYTVSVKSPRLLEYEGHLRWWHPAAWNRILANRLERSADVFPDEVALAHALLLGRGERLSDELRESFRRGGTYHLLVFSALQIAFAAGVIALVLRWLHAPRASDWLLLLFAVLAPLFIGPTPSVSRASVGIGLFAASRILRRPTSLENLWCLAALTRLMFEPRDLYDVSFHLTYAGAGALLFIGKPWRSWVDATGRVRRLPAAVLHYAVAAEIAISPLTLFHFNQYTLGGSVITVVMSPLIFAILIASSIATVVPHPTVFGTISWLHRACVALNQAGISGFHPSPPLPSLIAGTAVALCAIALLRERRRAVAVALALLIPTGAAVLRSVSLREVVRPSVTFFDVGQGDAIALRSGRETAVIDTGYGRQILQILGERGVRTIDHLFLSHAHPDHCDGIPALVENFDVRAVRVSARRFHGECATRILAACMTTATPVHIVRDGDLFRVGDFKLRAHVPDLTFRKAPDNNASLVLHARAGRRSFLFTGDIEQEAEIYLSDLDLGADVLKVAHHGSRSSSSRWLLDAVNPRIAAISCGRGNMFGHPHPSVIEALATRGIRIWRTDLHGSIDVEVEEGRLYVTANID